jgi:hypothetical protein
MEFDTPGRYTVLISLLPPVCLLYDIDFCLSAITLDKVNHDLLPTFYFSGKILVGYWVDERARTVL